MKQISRRSLGVGMLAAGVALTACGTDSDESAQPSGPVKLRMTTWSDNEEHKKLFSAIADAYVEANPDKVSEVSFEPLTDDYVGALTTQIAGGQVPDLAWVTEAYASQFIESGVFADLTDAFANAPDYDEGDLIESAMQLWTKDGKTYGYPFSNSPFGVFVNLDLVKAAGQQNPRDLFASGDWTWDNLMEIAAAIQTTQGVAGFNSLDMPSAWTQYYGAMWPGWGAVPWSEDGSTSTFNSPEMVDYFSWYKDQIFTHEAVPQPGEKFDFPSGQAGFSSGQLSKSAALEGFEWDFLPWPAGPSDLVHIIGQGGVGVLAQGQNPEIAADFLAFFTNTENGAKLAQFFPPPRTSLLTVDVLSKAAPALSADQIQSTVIDQAADAVTVANHPKMMEISDTIRADLDELWKPDSDVQAVLDKVSEDITPTIEQ